MLFEEPVVDLEVGMASVYTWLTEPRFTIGDSPFSVANLLKLLFYLVVMTLAARLIRRALVRRIFPRASVHRGTADILANITFYILVCLGVIVGLEASGINLSALTVVFGALGVGIGFGLQTIVSNFISGLVILFERPIRVGDTIQLGDLHGRVVQIRARATEVLTNDSITVIVPNSEFISQRVINWTHGSNSIRVHVPVNVAQGSDVEKVQGVLLEAAASVTAVLKSPPPKVWLRGFTSTSLDFELLAWTTELLHTRGEFVSQLNFAIYHALKKEGIAMPLPQQQILVRPGTPAEAALKGPSEPGIT